MADDNKPLKYMRYAVGEIILVVIGILIALQINNANEARIQESKITDIFEEILEETAINIEESERLISIYRNKDSLINLVLNDKVNFESYKNDYALYWLIQNMDQPKILNNGFENLMEVSENTTSKFEPLLAKVKYLYNFRNNKISQYSIQLDDRTTLFDRYLESNKSWYYKANFIGLGPDKDAIDFFLNDPIYKNYVHSYKVIAIMNLLNEIIKFRSDGIELYNEITEILNQGGIKRDNQTSFKTYTQDYSNLVGVYVGEYYGHPDTFEIVVENDTLFWVFNGEKWSINFLTKDLLLNEQDRFLYTIKRTENGNIKSITYPNGTLQPLEYFKLK